MESLISTNVIQLDDIALANILSTLYANLLNIDVNTLVFPRWQHEPPSIPDSNTTWISHGIVARRADINSSEQFINGTGTIIERNQELDSLISIYGPNMGNFEQRLRSGLSISQNRDYITQYGIVLVEVQKARNVSELINNFWQPKLDLVIIFRRRLIDIYPILPLLKLPINVITESNYTNDSVINL